VVKISAAGVNFIDVHLREGRYKAPLPFVNRQEATGVVTEVGADGFFSVLQLTVDKSPQ